MTDIASSPLGRATVYPEAYDPNLLFPVERAPLRAALRLEEGISFRGVDLWTAYELSWLDDRGKPVVAIASFAVPAASPRIVESKSVKLYLAAFNQTRFASHERVGATVARDLAASTGADVGVTLIPANEFANCVRAELKGELLDQFPLVTDRYTPDADILASGGRVVAKTWMTRLFRSVCPVTGQPDYASVQIRYRGAEIEPQRLLRYLVSFRRHPGFHEHCVETIFADITRRCKPEALSVYARFTRRGGIDINPYRTDGDEPFPANVATTRQ